jgi:hypothetical protein
MLEKKLYILKTSGCILLISGGMIPNGIVKEHCKLVKYSKSYQHEKCPFDIVFQGAQTYEDVLKTIESIEDSQDKEKILAYQKERHKLFEEEKKRMMGIEDNQTEPVQEE